MVAYDYEAQRWVEGPAAAKLLAEQQAEDAALLKDPAYRAFIAKEDEEPTCAACGCGGLDEDMGDCISGSEGIHAGCR